jgi:hypothetical protein
MPAIAPLDPIRLLASARSGLAKTRDALRSDHMTLNERSLRTYSSLMTHAFLHAAVAPARRLRRPSADFIEVGAALAQRLDLPTVPHMASAEMHRFVASDESDTQSRTLTVRASGLVEMLWALEQLPTGDGAWAINAIEPCMQLARFASLIASDDYGRLVSRSRLGRRRHMRVDWSLGITMTSAKEGVGRGWRDIILPDTTLERATGHEFGFMPPSGYGSARLRNVKRTESPNAVVGILLEEWLQANGYFHVEAAVKRVAEAAVLGCSPPTVPSQLPAASGLQ